MTDGRHVRTLRYRARPITDRQRAALAFIVAYIDEQGFPPTLREIGEGIGMKSTGGIANQLARLERKGFIRLQMSKARAIKVLRRSEHEEVT